jgi:probable addiction module antidote protein
MPTVDYDEVIIEMLREDKDFEKAYIESALQEYFEDGDKAAFLIALRHIVSAKGGVGKLAKISQVSREHLYYMLSEKGNPSIEKLVALLKGLGYRLSLHSLHNTRPSKS